MERCKLAATLLAALCFVVLTGHSVQCSDQSESFDFGAYWMPLTEGNTKSFVAENWENPITNEPFYYTQTVQGNETIKGIEGVKVLITDSNIPMGTYAKGSYDVMLPDLSEFKVTIKKYFPGNSAYGLKGSYQIPTPFTKSIRYGKPFAEGDWLQFTGISTCFDDNRDIFGQKKSNNPAVDTCTSVVTIKFLGIENVTVPAGSFIDCMKYKITISIGYAQNPQGNFSEELVTWSAKGIGEVKTEITSMMLANDVDFFPFNTVQSSMVSELVSATIDGVSYPK